MRMPAQKLDFSRENFNFNSVGFLLVCEGETAAGRRSLLILSSSPYPPFCPRACVEVCKVSECPSSSDPSQRALHP